MYIPHCVWDYGCKMGVKFIYLSSLPVGATPTFWGSGSGTFDVFAGN